MPTYKLPTAEVPQIVDEMLKRYHPALRDAGVTVGCLFAYATTDENGDSVGAAIKHHGYNANAVVRILNIKDRTKGLTDAEILIDGDHWDEWSGDQKRALIDHELEHLELRTDSDGLVIRDDLDRPKLRIRKHDHQFGWFDAIARRHGKCAFEVSQFDAFLEKRRQLWLPFEEGGSITGGNAIKAKGSDGAATDDQTAFKGEVVKAFEDAGFTKTGPNTYSIDADKVKAKRKSKKKPSKPTPADDREAILARAAELNDGTPGCLDVKVWNGAWTGGQDACKRGWELADCPYPAGDERDDYIRGYLGEQLLENCEPEPEHAEHEAAAV